MQTEILKIIHDGTNTEKRALYGFNKNTETELVLKKFNIWSRYFAPNYFSSDDAEFHKEIDFYNLKCYREEYTFVDIAFRGASKSSRTKLMIAYCIANDEDHYRRYIRILSQEIDNCKQFVTDIYNLLISPKVKSLYPEIFAKTTAKREETMSSFTTTTGIKVKSDTIGVNQRGAIQEDARPDLLIFDDIESAMSLRSAVKTYTIGLNMEEARTGLAVGGSCIYCCNYISEAGNVHQLVTTPADKKKILIVPIVKDNIPAWADRYTLPMIEEMRKVDKDFEGERMCCPSAGKSVFFDRLKIEKQIPIEPIEINNGFKIFKKYNVGGKYAGGHDISGGLGLDSSTSVFIDFSCFPAQVVATYVNNTIKPDLFAYEIERQSKIYNYCLVAPERNNNCGGTTIAILKQLDKVNIYKTEPKDTKIMMNAPGEYGWATNSATKTKMLDALADAIYKEVLVLNDIDLINELKYYTRDDVLDKEVDPRLSTRHFDLLISCFVKGTNILTDKGQIPIERIIVGNMVMTRCGYKKVVSIIKHRKKIIKNIGLVGTSDHPVICNDNEVKDLSKITNNDLLYIWNSKKGIIERLSYIRAQNIIDTQIQNYDNIEFITLAEQNGKKTHNTYIEEFGLIIMGIYQKVLLFIIKIITPLITALKIFVYYPVVNILNCICRIMAGRKGSETHSKKIDKVLRRDYENITITTKVKKQFVVFAEMFLWQNHIIQNYVQKFVLGDIKIRKKESPSKYIFARFVIKVLKQVFHIKKDVQYCVAKYEEEKYTTVYNLEVEDCPEYFANNILVHNCAIAFQMKDYRYFNKAKVNVYKPNIKRNV